ncbi:hypothetical protein TNCT_541881 [Trichonephila clavata]|uniref:Uncharacterized protein n=1 Tax=Trichonephila clavata TaxID=2740835 RepID=A0A8X6GAG3_TRICU|nr:hypothetical protein TNCT_541881 [Trichonephila clavata]
MIDERPHPIENNVIPHMLSRMLRLRCKSFQKFSLTHRPYCPDPFPYDFHTFAALKKDSHGHRLASDEEVYAWLQ